MSDQSVTTPTITAEILEITLVTLRRWCDYHAAHLSPAANPPAGQARRFTSRDIEVFKTVKQLRSQGFSVTNINDQLGKLTFAEIEPPDQAEAQDNQPQALAALPDGQHSTPAPIVAQDYVLSVERRFEALERSQRHAIYYIGIGFMGACLMFLLLIGLALLYGSLR